MRILATVWEFMIPGKKSCPGKGALSGVGAGRLAVSDDRMNRPPTPPSLSLGLGTRVRQGKTGSSAGAPGPRSIESRTPSAPDETLRSGTSVPSPRSLKTGTVPHDRCVLRIGPAAPLPHVSRFFTPKLEYLRNENVINMSRTSLERPGDRTYKGFFSFFPSLTSLSSKS